MIAASSGGRDHIGQWLVGRSIQVALRSSGMPASNDQSWLLAAYVWYCSDGKPVQMSVLGMSRRASLVELDGLAEDAARHRDRPLAERRLLRLAQAVEVLLRLDVRPDHRLLDVVEARGRGRPCPGAVST